MAVSEKPAHKRTSPEYCCRHQIEYTIAVPSLISMTTGRWSALCNVFFLEANRTRTCAVNHKAPPMIQIFIVQRCDVQETIVGSLSTEC